MMTSVKLNKTWTETQQEQVLRRDEPYVWRRLQESYNSVTEAVWDHLKTQNKKQPTSKEEI